MSQTWCSNSLTPDCPRLPQSFCNQTCGGNSSRTCGQGWTLEPIAFECTPGPVKPVPDTVGLTVSWGKLHYNISGDHTVVAGAADGPTTLLGSADLSPLLP